MIADKNYRLRFNPGMVVKGYVQSPPTLDDNLEKGITRKETLLGLVMPDSDVVSLRDGFVEIFHVVFQTEPSYRGIYMHYTRPCKESKSFAHTTLVHSEHKHNIPSCIEEVKSDA